MFYNNYFFNIPIKRILQSKILDPYQWLERPTLKRTKVFINAQNKIAQSFLEEGNERNEIKGKITNFFDQRKIAAPVRYGKYYFCLENSGLQNHA